MTKLTKFSIFTVLILTAGLALAAVQRLELNSSPHATALVGGLVLAPRSLLGSDTLINANKITRSLGGSATIDFASSSGAPEISASIAVLGARAGDTCEVGPNATAGGLRASFECFVDATDSVKVKFTPAARQRGTATLVSGTPSTVAVSSITASSICLATPVGTTAAIASAGLAVSLSSTTLTITGPDSVTTVVNYECSAPIDPASGVFEVRVTSND